MEYEMRKYKTYARDLKYLLISSGIWPNVHPFVRTPVAYLALFTTLITSLAMMNFSITHINNVMLVTKGMGLVISCFTCFLKVSIFLSHHDDIVYLDTFLTDAFITDLSNPRNRPFAFSHLGIITRLFYVLTYVVGISSFLSYVTGFISIKHSRLIFPSIFPVSYEPGGPVYWLFVSIELVANFFVWTVTSGVDSLFGYYTLQICGELRILSDRFLNLSSSGKYMEELRECIERHHLLMRCEDVLERLFGILAIWLAVTSAVIQCTLVFQAAQIAKAAISPFRFIFLCGYIVLKLVQAFKYALYGQLINEESAQCLESMYNARWCGTGDKRFMSDVLIVLSQKPLVFTAKGCMALKIEMFSKILNTAVSYFFLLRTLEEGNE